MNPSSIGRGAHLYIPILIFLCASTCSGSFSGNSGQPNVILCMADDLGWGDTRYNGHPRIETPNLDAMAENGIRFDRFYSASPVCSPTRGSCLTGRHAYRYGVFGANEGHLRAQELTLAEALKAQGYATGHFGKWHLGTLTKTVKDGNRGGPENPEHFNPPWSCGFDFCFSTENKTPTWNPMLVPGTDKYFGGRYWSAEGVAAEENLEGDDSRVLMDRVVPFVKECAEKEQPFFAVVWFHTPHEPVVAGPEYLDRYRDCTELEAHYYGCVTAMDAQIGRLRETLEELGVAQDTMFWFCSDNGPEDRGDNGSGSAGPFRGKKRSLYEGGIRVPALLEWPARVENPRTVETPCCTSDYLPTIFEFLEIEPEDRVEPLDGVSLAPVIRGEPFERPRPIAFQHMNRRASIGNRYKIVSEDGGKTYEMYDLAEDRSETKNLWDAHLQTGKEMKRGLEAWVASCERSLAGLDYR